LGFSIGEVGLDCTVVVQGLGEKTPGGGDIDFRFLVIFEAVLLRALRRCPPPSRLACWWPVVARSLELTAIIVKCHFS